MSTPWSIRRLEKVAARELDELAGVQGGLCSTTVFYRDLEASKES
jgi:hypothetical protein